MLDSRERASLLHPLTDNERMLVSERIRLDITEAASELLRNEQQTKSKLHSVHIKCVCLLVLASCAVGYAMIYLQGVLVPFTLAIFFMFLLEPLLFGLLNLPSWFGYFFPSLRSRVEQLEEQRRNHRNKEGDNRGEASPTGRPSSPRSPNRRPDAPPGTQRSPAASPTKQSDGTPALTSPNAFSLDASNDDDAHTHCADTVPVFLQAMSWRMWSLMSVLICLSTLLALLVSFMVVIVRSLNDFPWRKYKESNNMRLVLEEWFPHIGADPDNLKIESFMPWLVQGFLVDAINFTFTMISMAFLTFLFLAFLLASDINMMENDDFFGLADKVRRSVRRYIRIKTSIALVVASSVGFLLHIMRVDLAVLFGILTFLLSYIPHVGYTIAVLAPLPLVFLDPTKSWGDFAIIFIIPFMIHQFASNLIEPKLLASSLDLHPIVVLLALAFWTTVWGAVGAILSVPLTAVVRLILLEVDHPYTQPVVNLLKGRIRATAHSDDDLKRGRNSSKDSLNSPEGVAHEKAGDAPTGKKEHPSGGKPVLPVSPRSHLTPIVEQQAQLDEVRPRERDESKNLTPSQSSDPAKDVSLALTVAKAAALGTPEVLKASI